MTKGKIIDIIVVSVIYIITLIVIKPSVVSALTGVFLLFGAPSIYLAFRERKNLIKILIGSIFVGLPYMAGDILLSCNGAWIGAGKIFPFGQKCISLEELLWVFCLTLYTIIFYEHFYDDENTFRMSRRLKRVIPFSVGFFVLVLGLTVFSAILKDISYVYLKTGIVGIIPIILYLFIERRRLLKKFLPITIYFFIFDLAMEIRAVQLGWWSFPDINNYIGVFNIFGAIFPVEELIFWMILSTSFVLGYYELYVDDNA